MTNGRNEQLMRLVQQQVDSLKRSDDENEERKQIRENVDGLGIDPKAFQNEVSALRRMKPKARDYYVASQAEMRELLEGKREELFPEIVAAEAEKEKKAEGKKKPAEKADKAAAAAAESQPARSPTTKETDEQIKKTAADLNAEKEQREGAEILHRGAKH